MTRVLDILAVFVLLALSALVVVAAAQSLPAAGHYVLVAVLLGALAVLKLFRPARYFRFLMVAVAGFVVLRYAIWRTFETLPSPEDPATFAIGLALYLAEAYAIAMLALNLFVIADPIQRGTPAAPSDPADLPSVDLFVPSYDEDPALVANTLRAAADLDYPEDLLKVYLLDDGATDAKLNAADPIAAGRAAERRDALRAVCAQTGATYLSRADNAGAKAGNLNAALARTKGDLVAVFDADHAPTRDFLNRTAPHFLEDPRLFLVQTPHVFLNADPLERNLGLAGRMPGENEMFYAMVQKGLDRWNAAFFCGSAALLRRAALAETDGFSGVSVTEDCETALELHARGWNSRYVDRPMVSGLNPETFGSFVGQRARWLQGMMQIFVLKNPLLKRGLSTTQRLGYLSAQLFWLFPLPRLVFFLAPLAYLFAGLEIYAADFAGFAAYTIPYMVAILTLSDAVYGAVRRPFISDLYETIQSVFLIKALVGVLARPLRPRFNVTAKGDLPDRDHLSPLAWPFALLAGALGLGLAAGAVRYQADPQALPVLAIVGGFTLLNLAMVLAALGVCCERRQRRYYPRLPLDVAVEARIDDAVAPARLMDVSPGGARIEVPGARAESFRNARALALGMPGEAQEVAIVVRELRPAGERLVAHVVFEPRREAERRLVTRLNYGDSAPIAGLLRARRARRGALVGTLAFFWVALRSAFTAILFAARTGRGIPKENPPSSALGFDGKEAG